MSDFEEAIRQALDDRNREQTAIAVADRDLHEVCAKAAVAVQKLTADEAKLELSPIPSGSAARAYTLDFVTDEERRTVQVFAVMHTGYPLYVFPSLEQWDIAQPRISSYRTQQLENRAKLEAAVNALARSESELVTLVESVLRNRKERSKLAGSTS